MDFDKYSKAKVIVKKEEIPLLIPHQPPMIMVSELYKSEDSIIVSGFTISNDNILLDEGLFKESGLLENMAQTVALGFSYRSKQQKENGPQMGYLVSANRFSIIEHLKPGSSIITVIQIIKTMGQFTKAGVQVFFNKKQIAKAQISLFQTTDAI